MKQRLSRRFVFGGRVQGVGFRPFIFRLAKKFQMTGWVRNQRDTVEIIVNHDNETLNEFRNAILQTAPYPAIPILLLEELVDVDTGEQFRIIESNHSFSVVPSAIPDLGICDHCLSEMDDVSNRRFHDLHTQCSNCGPRYTSITQFPYERVNTSLRGFTMCPTCNAEYFGETDRRFYCQNQCCQTCGPSFVLRVDGRCIGNVESIIAESIALLENGKIGIVKGIGGFHFICDATNPSAIERLRKIKHRPDKPFAIMVPFHAQDVHLSSVVEIADIEIRAIRGRDRAIIIAERAKSCALPALLAPKMATLGVMYPYTPLYYLLTRVFNRELVVTSANISGQSLIYRDNELPSIEGVSDFVITHDREIIRPVEDSVKLRIGDYILPIRVSRGQLPFEIRTKFEFKQPVLALGGHKKNAIALGIENRIILTSYSGDLDSYSSLLEFSRAVDDIGGLYGVTPAFFLADAHPQYAQQQWLRERGFEAVPIFHHRAHASASLAESVDDEPCLAIVWDGLGYGEDGTLWGGESFIGTPGHWQRVASIEGFRLIGLDQAAKEPARIAASLCWHADMNVFADRRMWRQLWSSGQFSPMCSSIGRLFDGFATLAGLTENITYEAQLAMQWQQCARQNLATFIELPYRINQFGLRCLDWRPMISRMIDDSTSMQQKSSLFHSTLAYSILSSARWARTEFGIQRVTFSGGVFQNRFLTEMATKFLCDDGFSVNLSSSIPVNDIGLAVGQLVEYAGRAT